MGPVNKKSKVPEDSDENSRLQHGLNMQFTHLKSIAIKEICKSPKCYRNISC